MKTIIYVSVSFIRNYYLFVFVFFLNFPLLKETNFDPYTQTSNVGFPCGRFAKDPECVFAALKHLFNGRAALLELLVFSFGGDGKF